MIRHGFLCCIIAVAIVGAAAGCGSRGRRGGPVTPTDAGGDRTDGTIDIIDGGTPIDSGIMLMDSGMMRIDSGMMGFDAGGTCETSTVTFVTGSYCPPGTVDCVSTCAAPACDVYSMCLETDPVSYPDCAGCVDNNIISCANSNGCQRSWDLFICCLDTNCAGLEGAPLATCRDAWCATQADAFSSCLGGLPAGTCSSAIPSCE